MEEGMVVGGKEGPGLLIGGTAAVGSRRFRGYNRVMASKSL